MPQVFIVADDLTGAADTAGGLARAGLATCVLLPHISVSSSLPLPPCDIFATSTETRNLNDAQAATQVGKIFQALRGHLSSGQETRIWVYKKMDSTLRGHPAVELKAMMDVMGQRRALVAPAFPAQGRTTVGGRQLIDGVPIERTSLGLGVPCSDLKKIFRPNITGYPLRHADLTMIRRGAESFCQILNDSDPAVWVADAETDDDLLISARAALKAQIRFLCGSAGLARALAQVLNLKPTAPTPPFALMQGQILVAAGSRHPRTCKQVEFLRQMGATVLSLDLASLSGDQSRLQKIVREISKHITGRRDVVLTTAASSESSSLSGGEAVSLFSRLVKDVLRQVTPRGLVLTGGDTAAAVCANLEATALWLRGEVQPGIPWGILSDGLLHGLAVVTKAGGFGGHDALARAISFLHTVC